MHPSAHKALKKTPTLHPSTAKSATASLCLLNARSIVNKSAPLGELLNDVQPDIVAITETWLTRTHGDNDLAACCPPGYSSAHVPRATGRGGGVALLFKSTIAVHRHTCHDFTSFELLDCSLSLHPKSI